MAMNYPRIPSVALLFLSTLVAFAQPKEPIVVDMDKALTLALQLNADLKLAALEREKSEEKLREARSGLFPQFNLSGQYQRYIDLPVIFLPPGSPFGPTLKIGSNNSFLGSASLTVPLFAWSLYKSIGLASDAVTIAQENYRNVKNKVVADVKKAFLAVLLMRETKEVMEQSLKNAEDNFENVKKLRAGGLLSDYDVLRAEVQVENLKPAVLQMENNYKLAREALKIAIGLAADQEITVVGEMSFEEPYLVPSEQEVVAELLRNNPQLAILDHQVRLNEQTVALEQAAYLPMLSGFGNYQYQAQANDFKFSQYNWVKTFVVGVQLQIPIFNGFKTQARVGQAEIGLEQATEQKRTLTEALKTQALSILYRVQQAVRRIEGQNKTVQQAAEGYRIAQQRFANSLATQLEVNDAELALRQARLNRLQAIYDLKVAESELESVLGKH
jgi:outer membrane protein TolC